MRKGASSACTDKIEKKMRVKLAPKIESGVDVENVVLCVFEQVHAVTACAPRCARKETPHVAA